MPSSSGAPSFAISLETGEPQSPPCATNFLYPSRFISTTQARAIRCGSQPAVVGLPEKPQPGIEGISYTREMDPLLTLRRSGQDFAQDTKETSDFTLNLSFREPSLPLRHQLTSFFLSVTGGYRGSEKRCLLKSSRLRLQRSSTHATNLMLP
ncbi:hypothetical protein H8A95_09260 [Bradyrhizobium sp. Pear76]|uniref:hypothetical protein n=1 Tax=Bradyrhizobium oropedii TaxID=1571201 RepID=UPI003B8470C4|nr:hypothetical protein [Bradyrhizobium oropedii]